MNKALHVGVRIYDGEDSVSFALNAILELAKQHQIAEVVYDNWKASVLVQVLEAHGLKLTVFGQSDQRMCPASAALHEAVVQRKIVHPDDEALNRHVAVAIAKQKPRGWRIWKSDEKDQIDAVVAMAMCLEAVTAPEPPPTRVLGWL